AVGGGATIGGATIGGAAVDAPTTIKAAAVSAGRGTASDVVEHFVVRFVRRKRWRVHHDVAGRRLGGRIEAHARDLGRRLVGAGQRRWPDALRRGVPDARPVGSVGSQLIRTAHVIEAFGQLGMTMQHAAVGRAMAFIRREQENDGSWFGRWGVNHIYGTAAVLPALRAIGENMSEPYILRAADWIVSKQNSDGGWGETCASYMGPELRGVGPSTPSQAAWALMALLSLDNARYFPSILAGLSYLQRTQNPNGSWDE